MTTVVQAQKRFEQEEEAYWAKREALLEAYRGKWVAIVGGQVVAVADQMNKAAAEAFRKTQSSVMFVALVGNEDVEFRVRQVAIGRFDPSYRLPMPMVRAGLGDLGQESRQEVEFVVDTGADITVIGGRKAEALKLRLYPSAWARVSAFDGRSERRPLYSAMVHLADQAVVVVADCRDEIQEDILGRDVINEFALTVCAKRDEVRFEWVGESADVAEPFTPRT